jgi:hypothetical protein
VAARKYSIRNYNVFLREVRRRESLSHKQAQAVYRYMRKALKNTVRKSNIDDYPDLFDEAVDSALNEVDEALIDKMLNDLQLDDTYAPDITVDGDEIMLSIRGRNYQRTISASIRRDGKQISLFNWRTVTDRSDGSSEVQGG